MAVIIGNAVAVLLVCTLVLVCVHQLLPGKKAGGCAAGCAGCSGCSAGCGNCGGRDHGGRDHGDRFPG